MAILTEDMKRVIRSPQTLANIRRGSLVEVKVCEARAVVSPAYDDGTLSEADMIRRFRARQQL